VMNDEVHAGLDRNSDLSVGDGHRITHDPYVLVEHRLAGPDVVFPRMPRAAQNATLLTIVELVHVGWQSRAHHAAQTHPRGLVRARVLERVELAVEVEYPDFASFDAHDLPTARWDLVDARYNVLGHCYLPVTCRGASRRSPYTDAAFSHKTL